jgi:[ribosomal protein S5]-alanine N-acetyltransferase
MGADDLCLRGERVVMRPPRPDDLDGFRGVFTDPQVMRYVAAGRPLSATEVEEWLGRMIARFNLDGFGQFALVRQSDSALIGRTGLLPLDPETWQSGSLDELGAKAEIELGWTLARAYWGHGYATEAAMVVRDWAWSELGLTRLVSIIQVGNDRSVRLATQLGGLPEREITTSFGKRARLFGYARPAGLPTPSRRRRWR